MPPLDQQLLEHVPQLQRYARVLTGNATDADDLVQECLTKLLAKRLSCRGIRNMRAYLFAALHNLHVGQRNGHRWKQLALDSELAMDGMVVPPTQIDSLIVRDLGRALQMLPPGQREVVVLVGLDGLKYCEAASVLGIPLGTVMSRLSRGREALRALMDDQRGRRRSPS